MADDRYNIRRPQPGRPSDRRVDEAYLRVRPELNGLEPFDEAEDIDVIDEVQRVVNNVRADVAYADPALGAALDTALNDTLPAKVAEVDAAVDAIPGQVSAGLAPVAPALADIAQDRALAQQATQAANDAADVIGAAGLIYLGTDAEGIATLMTVEARVTVTDETTTWAVIDGSVTLTQPSLTIGGTA